MIRFADVVHIQLVSSYVAGAMNILRTRPGRIAIKLQNSDIKGFLLQSRTTGNAFMSAAAQLVS